MTYGASKVKFGLDAILSHGGSDRFDRLVRLVARPLFSLAEARACKGM
jgi:hypothetical protein